jgi:peroxiredoxin
MARKVKKKSWKEKQRERQIKQQGALEGYRTQLEREAQKKPRKLSKGKIILGFCLVAAMFTAYGAWQYYIGLPPSIGSGAQNNPQSTGSAPNFSIKDINGTQFSLNQYRGRVIAIHFMAVGCHGQYYSINDHQLKQLRTVCNVYCDNEAVTMITLAVSACPTSDLARIRANYDITWLLGNDYDDGKLDVINAYAKYSIDDGTIVLIDKTFNVAQVYTKETAAETLSSKIDQLLGS